MNSINVIVNGADGATAKALYLPYSDVRYQWRSGSPPIATQTQYRPSLKDSSTSQRLEMGVRSPPAKRTSG